MTGSGYKSIFLTQRVAAEVDVLDQVVISMLAHLASLNLIADDGAAFHLIKRVTTRRPKFAIRASKAAASTTVSAITFI